jgi:HEAT repeat protein
VSVGEAATLDEAATLAEQLAEAGDQRGLAELRTRWEDEVEAAARSQDFRQRAQAFRALGSFRYRQKLELLRRGLEDESPACRGVALVSLERLSRDGPAPVNSARALLHELATRDPNAAVRRLAILCLKNGSPQRDTILILESLADHEDEPKELRQSGKKVAELLRRKSR